MAGTKSRVRNVAKESPKMMVQESEPQNITLSPPKWMWGLSWVKSVMKLMFIPTASGTSPRMVAVAVRTTGVIRVFPACTMASLVLSPLALSTSVNSTISIPFRTTMPPRATTPSPVMMTDMSMWNMTTPRRTPMMENMTSDRMMMDFERELNCVMRMKNMSPRAMIMAVDRKFMESFCSTSSPVSTISTPLGFWNVAASLRIRDTISLVLNPGRTSEDSVMTRLKFLRLIPP